MASPYESGNDRGLARARYLHERESLQRVLAIAKVTGARVIVDSSRPPFEPVALGLVPSVDVHIADLIRDPRAVVYSWKRVRKLTDRDTGEEFPRYSAAFSTASWTIRNLVVEMIRRRNPVSVVRYDTLASDPAGTLQRLADFVGEPAGDLGFLKWAAPTLHRRTPRAVIRSACRAVRSRSNRMKNGASTCLATTVLSVPPSRSRFCTGTACR